MLVAVDGPDAAGKTVLADRLAGVLREPVVRASVDDFLRPRAERAPLSPEGYYRSAFDVGALEAVLLTPFATGAPTVRTAVRDLERDEEVDVRVDVPERAVLVVDGVFLLRPALRRHWSLSVHLTVPPEVALARAAVRDRDRFEDVERRYRERYLPAQEAYERDARPRRHADVVVDNSDPTRPVLLPAGA